MKAKLEIIGSMAAFGTIGAFVRHIPLPSGELALYRAVLAAVQYKQLVYRFTGTECLKYRIAAFYCQFFKSHVFSPAPMHSCASSSNSPSFLSPCPKSSAIRSICSVRYKYPIRASNPVAIL